MDQLDELTAGYDWRKDYSDRASRGDTKPWFHVVTRMGNHLRNPATPGNEVAQDQGDQTAMGLATAYRQLSSALARAGALCSASGQLEEVRPSVHFDEEARV